MENIIKIKMRTKRFEEYIKESYEPVPDDYSYFRRMVIDPQKSEEENKLHVIENKPELVNMLIKSARGHWGIGSDEPFPEEVYYKVINDVLDKIILEK